MNSNRCRTVRVQVLRLCTSVVLLSFATPLLSASVDRLLSLVPDANETPLGRRLLTRSWTTREGLGPEVNALSCVGCHAVAGVSRRPSDERSFAVLAHEMRDPAGGHVFRRLRVEPLGGFTELQVPAGAVKRRAPSLVGLGLLERVASEVIAAKADPNDADRDGISGRSPQGRYGWKARIKTLDEAVSAAFATELGLSTARFADTVRPKNSSATPEIGPAQVQAVVAFIRSLSPAPQNDREPEGRQLFNRIGCAACHAPMDGRVFDKGQPYTDLLLHDMGPALADGLEEGNASGSEFRTPPLWGIAKAGPPYLHDGRAPTLHDAIVAHGGEAERAASAYRALPPQERDRLLRFLRSR